MKIFYICYADMAGHNGAVRHIVEIIINLQKLGHQVQLCVPRFSKYRDKLPLNIRYIPVVNLPVIRPLVFILIAPFLLIVYLLKFKPNAVYVREIGFSLCQEALILKLLNYPSAIEINGMFFEQLKLVGVFSYLKPIFKFIQRTKFKFFDKILVHTAGLKEEIQKIYNIQSFKLEVIPMGVNTESFKPMPKKDVRSRLNLALGRYYIGFVGGLMSWQGIDNLIASSPFIIKEIPGVTFLIVGWGRLKNAFINMVKELGLEQNFIFTGEVSFETVPLYINAFDIGIVFFKPVRKDPGDPIKLYEYLACGIPILASNVKGYGDVVERIGAGKAVDSSKPQEISRVIVDLLRNNGLRDEMANRGPASVEVHTWLNRAKQIEDCFNNIISR
ncbi:glycosyltransferase family 4 protein [Candidatus Omnitrophota bacterium]